LRPNSYWSREEGQQNESEENRSADIPEAEDKNEVFERIKENLDQEQQKFMENLLDDQVLSKIINNNNSNKINMINNNNSKWLTITKS